MKMNFKPTLFKITIALFSIFIWYYFFLSVNIVCQCGYGSRKGAGAVYRTIKVVVEHHAAGYVAYPLGLKGVVVGEGDTYAEALQDIESAIRFHIESFGDDVLDPDPDSPVLEAFVAEAGVQVK